MIDPTGKRSMSEHPLQRVVNRLLAEGAEPIIGLPAEDFEAWEQELDTPTIRAALEYMEGE